MEKKALQMEDLRYQKRQCESYCEESPNIANPFHVLKTSTEMRFATHYFTQHTTPTTQLKPSRHEQITLNNFKPFPQL